MTKAKYLRTALLVAGMMTFAGTLNAQEVKHLNPAIEKLAAGKPFIGFQTSDYSLENARTIARADREPSGSRDTPGPSGITVTAWQRIRAAHAKLGTDAQLDDAQSPPSR